MSLRRRSLLTAYLDGELSARHRAGVERALASSPALREELDELRRLVDGLGRMPRVSLPEPVGRDLMSRLRKAAADPVSLWSDLMPDEIELLLTAYAYDELDAPARREVEGVLLADPAHRKMVDQFRRLRSAMEETPRRAVPNAVLAVVLDRLHRVSEQSASQPRPPLEEYLSAYLDAEVSDRKREKIEKRLAESESARSMLSGLDRVRSGLSELPRVGAPTGLMKNVLAEIADEESTPVVEVEPVASGLSGVPWSDERPKRGRAGRSALGWDRLLVAAASIFVVAGLGLVLRALPMADKETVALLNQHPEHPPKTIKAPEPVGEPAAADEFAEDEEQPVQTPKGLDDLRDILRSEPHHFASKINHQQVTLRTTDVGKVLDMIGLASQATDADEHGHSQVVDLKGPSSEVNRVLSQVEETTRRGNLVESVDIAPPNNELLAHLERRRDGVAPADDSKSTVDVVASVRQSLSQLQREIQRLSSEKGPAVPAANVASRNPNKTAPAPARKAAPAITLPNEPTVIARPLRVLLVVEPKKKK